MQELYDEITYQNDNLSKIVLVASIGSQKLNQNDNFIALVANAGYPTTKLTKESPFGIYFDFYIPLSDSGMGGVNVSPVYSYNIFRGGNLFGKGFAVTSGVYHEYFFPDSILLEIDSINVTKQSIDNLVSSFLEKTNLSQAEIPGFLVKSHDENTLEMKDWIKTRYNLQQQRKIYEKHT